MEIDSSQRQEALSFEKQFGDKQTFPFPEGEVNAVDVEPNDSTDIPVLLAPGWCENQDTYKKSLRVIHDEGFLYTNLR